MRITPLLMWLVSSPRATLVAGVGYTVPRTPGKRNHPTTKRSLILGSLRIPPPGPHDPRNLATRVKGLDSELPGGLRPSLFRVNFRSGHGAPTCTLSAHSVLWGGKISSRVCGVLAGLIRPASDVELVPLPRRQGVRDPVPRSQMLYRICGVDPPSYPGLLTCLGCARPTGVMQGLIAPSVLRPRLDRLFALPRHRAGRNIARPVLGGVCTTSMSGWQHRGECRMEYRHPTRNSNCRCAARRPISASATPPAA